MKNQFLNDPTIPNNAPKEYYMTENVSRNSLQRNEMDCWLFDVKVDGYVRVAKFWGYDLQSEARLTKEEARKVWVQLIKVGFKVTP